MGLLFRRGIKGPGGAGPVPEISGVRVQLRKPQVTLSKAAATGSMCGGGFAYPVSLSASLSQLHVMVRTHIPGLLAKGEAEKDKLAGQLSHPRVGPSPDQHFLFCKRPDDILFKLLETCLP